MDYTSISAAIFIKAEIAAGKTLKWTILPLDEKMNAKAIWITGELRAAEPVDDTTLAIFAHESGHMALRHFGLRQPIIHQEAAATKWALQAIREAGGNPGPAVQKALRKALASYVPRKLDAMDELMFTLRSGGRIAPKDPPNAEEQAFLDGGDW